MIRFAIIFVVAFLFAPRVQSSDAALALADRATFAADPVRQSHLYYLTTERLAGMQRGYVDLALRLVIPSASLQTNTNYCSPVQIGPTCYRIDLSPIDQGGLGWDLATWQQMIAKYPYRFGTVDIRTGNRNSLLLRADWLLVQLTDGRTNDAYYPLVYGTPAPKTIDDILARLDVSKDEALQFGLIEGNSGVSVQGVRLVKNFPMYRGSVWGTFDTKQLSPDRDPLEQLENDAKFDGSEWIFKLPKLHVESGTWGGLLSYALANGDNVLVKEAPADLVEDHTRFRDTPVITNCGSCIQCHGSGLNQFKRNEVRELREAGVRVLTYDDHAAVAAEAFHLADLDKEVARDNEDFQSIVELLCDRKAEDVAVAFAQCVREHDRPLYLDDAARELGRQPKELRLAIANAAAYGIQLTFRAKGLAEGLSQPRRSFEEEYLILESVCEQWEAAR